MGGTSLVCKKEGKPFKGALSKFIKNTNEES